MSGEKMLIVLVLTSAVQMLFFYLVFALVVRVMGANWRTVFNPFNSDFIFLINVVLLVFGWTFWGGSFLAMIAQLVGIGLTTHLIVPAIYAHLHR